ncbi:MAG: hypothetical protein NTY88_02090 [Bacteroidetes bacterium]|nr:hypothetical protein [Bacteroidota bacterium]
MKYINALPKIFLVLFFITAVSVHVIGLVKPFSPETPLSHIVHVVSYSLCLLTILKRLNFGIILYVIGSIYPYFIHAQCTYIQYTELNKLNAICIYTVIMLTAGFIFLLKEKRAA